MAFYLCNRSRGAQCANVRMCGCANDKLIDNYCDRVSLYIVCYLSQ
jgi:hypothetical protein